MLKIRVPRQKDEVVPTLRKNAGRFRRWGFGGLWCVAMDVFILDASVDEMSKRLLANKSSNY